MENNEVTIGTVKALFVTRGFGFVGVEHESDLFFHATSCASGDFELMNIGSQVSFHPGNRAGRPVAVGVKLLPSV
ncbi:MAG: cold shock domain-containing protein [Acidobacteriia bacterium]|nr:cold shock domain-containing protein [Terriglobia bacterium]